MKFLLSLCLFSWVFVGQSQTINEIKLSQTLSKDSLCTWLSGDYQVNVELGSMIESFRMLCKNFEGAADYYQVTDSSTLLFYNHTSTRYRLAIDQMEHDKDGFDLNGLILYDGIEDEKRNIGNSYIVQRQVQSLVERGKAMVYYKGKLVDSLQTSYEIKAAELLYSNYIYKIYYDDPENCLIMDIGYMSW